LELAEASLQLAESSRVREIQTLRDQLSQSSADHNLREKLIEAEKKVLQLQTALEKRSSETNKLITG
jgi:hypothetical protein